jgi:hypothetical protein
MRAFFFFVGFFFFGDESDGATFFCSPLFLFQTFLDFRFPPNPQCPTIHQNSNDAAAVDRALDELGVETERRDLALRGEMARGMFDTRGKVDPFDKASPIKQCAITRFPPDMFFVLRVVQLLRGMANGEFWCFFCVVFFAVGGGGGGGRFSLV